MKSDQQEGWKIQLSTQGNVVTELTVKSEKDKKIFVGLYDEQEMDVYANRGQYIDLSPLVGNNTSYLRNEPLVEISPRPNRLEIVGREVPLQKEATKVKRLFRNWL